MRDQIKALDFWHQLEVLHLPDLPDSHNRKDKTHRINSQADLDACLLCTPRYKNNVVKHVLYLGILDKENAHKALIKEDAPEPANGHFAPKEKIRGKTCLLSFALNDRLQPVPHTYFIASFAWGLGRLRRGGNLLGFKKFFHNQKKGFQKRWSPRKMDGLPQDEEKQEVVRPKATYDDLVREVELVLDSCGVREVLDDIVIIRRSCDAGINWEAKDNQADLLNSFYLNDLELLPSVLGRNAAGAGLKAYLGLDVPGKRIDLLEDRPALIESLDPKHVKPGRWPSDPEKPPFLCQQAALNTILSTLDKRPGLISVNGPPGTGKTVLLREVLAAVVTDRAARLAELENPRDLFLDQDKAEVCKATEIRQFNCHLFRPEFNLGDALVVASSNNDAVENISLELPMKTALHGDIPWSYLSETARQIHGDDSWGLVSVKLGKKQNIDEFTNSFWFDQKSGFTIRKMLQGSARRGAALSKWSQTRRSFLQDLARFRDIRRDLHTSHAALISLRTDCDLAERLGPRLERLRAEVDDLDEQKQGLKRRLRRLTERKGKYSPPGFAALFLPHKWLSLAAWVRNRHSYRLRLKDISRRIRELKIQQETVNDISTKKKDTLRNLQKNNDDANTRILSNKKTITAARKKYPQADLPGLELFDAPISELHIRSPWTFKDLNKLRSTLFRKALSLHELTIMANNDRFMTNLSLLVDDLRGQLVCGSPKIRPAVWTSLFFCIPLVSTTLASFPRLFGKMDKEDLGWLLLDEAAQAVPQAAAGPIWRAERCIATGDPMQIEPIVTLPMETLAHVANRTKVRGEYWPNYNSAQVLADRANVLGAFLQTNHHETRPNPLPTSSDNGYADHWVGLPLRTHCRCMDPMFSISNEIAYDGQMVNAVGPRECALPRSFWLHVPAKGYVQNTSLDEIQALAETLKDMVPDDLDDCLIITPFRSVRSESNKLIKSLFPTHNRPPVGTIHSFQGREAGAVFIVLGGGSAGARMWAAKRPNIINCAVSRAKNRLYVIGDHDKWSALPHFDILAKHLPRIDA